MPSRLKSLRRSRRKGRSLLGRLSRTPAAFRVVAGVARGAQALVGRLGPARGGALASRIARLVAPLVPETRIARANLDEAFPERTPEERRAILSGVWDNLARTAAEMTMTAELARDESRFDIVGREHFYALRDDGKPGILFSAHTANWEVLSVLASRNGLPITSLYRAPANPYLAEDLLSQRSALMGPQLANRPGVAVDLMAAMKRGEHLGLFVDQRAPGGLPLPFFGRMAEANRFVGKLARIFECPVAGARAIRLPGGRFRVEVTPPLTLPRDSEGKVDVDALTRQITEIVESWVREYPEQWLWLHNRWGR